MFVHACMCVCACGCTHIRCSVCMWRMHAQVGTTRYLCRHACTGVCVCARHTHACMLACMCVHVIFSNQSQPTYSILL